MQAWSSPPPFGRWWIIVNLSLAVVWTLSAISNVVSAGSPWRSVLLTLLAVFSVERAWSLGRPRTRIDETGIHSRGYLRTRHIPWDRVLGKVQYEVDKPGLTVLLTDDSRHVLWDATRHHQSAVARVVDRYRPSEPEPEGEGQPS